MTKLHMHMTAYSSVKDCFEQIITITVIDSAIGDAIIIVSITVNITTTAGMFTVAWIVLSRVYEQH